MAPEAVSYREDVEQRRFPSDAESYHLPEAVRSAALIPVGTRG